MKNGYYTNTETFVFLGPMDTHIMNFAISSSYFPFISVNNYLMFFSISKLAIMFSIVLKKSCINSDFEGRVRIETKQMPFKVYFGSLLL
jgi:hypothetical protein